MKHSNREQMENYYQDESNKKSNQSRFDDFSLSDKNVNMEPKQKHSAGCALLTILIVASALYLIYFLYINIKGPLIAEITKQQENITNLSNQGEDLKNNADDFLSSTNDTLNEAQEVVGKINALKDALSQAKNMWADLSHRNDPEKTPSQIQQEDLGIVEQTENIIELPPDYVPYWLYQMREQKQLNIPEFRCEFLDQVIYLSLGSQPGCADCYSDYIYNADGEYRCAAGGGLTGRGDGACPGIFADLTDCVVWNGEKWEKTVIK